MGTATATRGVMSRRSGFDYSSGMWAIPKTPSNASPCKARALMSPDMSMQKRSLSWNAATLNHVLNHASDECGAELASPTKGPIARQQQKETEWKRKLAQARVKVSWNFGGHALHGSQAE